MKKLNAKGFSPLHILLLIVMVGLIGGVGYYVYSSQKKTNTALDNAAKSQGEPQKSEKKEEVKKQTITVDYANWDKVAKPELSENETAQYKAKNGNATLSVYSTNPIIFYSSNAPYYCKYENNQWVAYSGTNSSGAPTVSYTKEASNTNCDSVKKETIKDFTTYSRYGGAEARVSLSVAVENGDEWFVFKDYIDSPDIESLTEAKASKDKDTLHKNIESLISKTLVVN